MHTHETESLLPERSQHPACKRCTDDGAEGLASRALAAGRSDTLHPAALLHLQRAAGNSSVSSLLEENGEERSPVKDVVGRGGGQPMDASTRGFMEERFGQDFGSVRIHTDARAAESARTVNAQAYTVGEEIVFREGRFQPETEPGRHVLAHELTHVVQQRSGPVAGTPAAGGINISDPQDSFEQEAERNAARVMTPPAAEPVPAATTPAPPVQRTEAPGPDPSLVQRQDEEEEEVQGSFVQRDEEEEEEVQGSFVQRQDEEEEKEEEPAPS
jgi:hypothetical protein